MLNKLSFFCFSVLMLLANVMYAPPLVPTPGGSSPATPIDGGIAVLLAAGTAYGVKKVIDLKKKKSA